MENIRVLRRIFTIFGIALLITGVLIYLYRSSFEKFQRNSEIMAHTIELQEKIELLLGKIKDTETGTRGFVITGDPVFLEPFERAKPYLKTHLEDLRNLLDSDSIQKQKLDSVALLLENKISVQNFIIHLKKTDNFKFGYKELLLESNILMDSIIALTAQIKSSANIQKILIDMEVAESMRYSRIMSTIFSLTALSIMVISLLYILWEIRSKRKVKDLLKTVLESSQSGIMSFVSVRNFEGEIVDFIFIQVNFIGAEMLNSKANDLVGKSLLKTFPGNISEGLFDAYVDVVENNTIFRTEKYYNHDGLNFWLRIVAVKLEDGFTVTFDDISKEKRYEEELKNYIFNLKRSNSELEQFAFIASHDLQEPLRKIQTFGDRLKSKSTYKDGDPSSTYIEKMLSAANRMSKLINDLLSFSRLAKSNEGVAKVNLNKIVEDIKVDLEVIIQSKNAIIRTNNLPSIEGIGSQLYQLLSNLIGNAIKFSKEGIPPIIDIHAETLTYKTSAHNHTSLVPGEPYVKITIKDNGIGFEGQYAERIFEIFQRLHGRSEFEGTGIGLAICKRIVSNHRGTISAASTPNEGATFVMELPISQKN